MEKIYGCFRCNFWINPIGGIIWHMSDQNKSDGEKKKDEEKDYELRIDPYCSNGVIRVPKDKENKNTYQSYD